VQKPIATTPAIAREMVRVANDAKVVLNVVSQHRFDDSTRFLKRAIAAGRLGKILQAVGHATHTLFASSELIGPGGVGGTHVYPVPQHFRRGQ